MEEVPFEDRHVPRTEIEWDRSLWWWVPITRSIHPAIKLTTLVLSLVAVGLIQSGAILGRLLFSPFLEGSSARAPSMPSLADSAGSYQPWSSPIVEWFSNGFNALLGMPFGWREVAFATFFLLWLTLVASLLGGVLARRAMVELGQRTIAPWGESFQIIFRRWQSFLWVTGMHFVGITALLLPYALLGWIASLGSTGATISGILLIASFPVVFAVGRLMISMIACFPLSVCAIAAEKKADAFEGFSRSNAYLFQRPVVAVACVLLLSVIGFVGELIVKWTLFFGWGAIRTIYSASGGALESTNLIYLRTGNLLSQELITAYWFSFFWAASAALYLVLRRTVDSTNLDELDGIENPAITSLPEIPRSPESPENKSATDNSTERNQPDTSENSSSESGE